MLAGKGGSEQEDGEDSGRQAGGQGSTEERRGEGESKQGEEAGGSEQEAAGDEGSGGEQAGGGQDGEETSSGAPSRHSTMRHAPLACLLWCSGGCMRHSCLDLPL